MGDLANSFRSKLPSLMAVVVYFAWYDALQILSTANTGSSFYIEPLIAMIVAFVILGEAITFASLLGGGVILFGVWLVSKN